MMLATPIATLDALGVRLSPRLVVDAPRGVLTPELKDALRDHKGRLLSRLARDLEWAELSTWRWGPASGDQEPGIVIDRPDRERMRHVQQLAALTGPRRTPWGTVVYSAPDGPSIEVFGPPPARTRIEPPPASSSPGPTEAETTARERLVDSKPV